MKYVFDIDPDYVLTVMLDSSGLDLMAVFFENAGRFTEDS